MLRRSLGQSGLEITSIGVGTWAIGGWMWGGQDDAASIAAIHAAVDHGVNWIDTAPIYGSGHSERVVGRAIAALPASRRPMVFTKFGLGDDSQVTAKSAGHADVLAECDAQSRSASASIASISTSSIGRSISRLPRPRRPAPSC